MNEERKLGLRDTMEIMVYFLKLTYRIYPAYLLTLFLSSFFKAVSPFVNIVIPKFLIDELMQQKRPAVFIGLVLTMIGGNFIFNLINKWFAGRVVVVNERLFHRFDLMLSCKIVDMDFENIENPEILDLKERVTFVLYNEGAIFRLVENLANLVSYSFSIIGLVSVIMTFNGWILMLTLGMIAINSRFFKIIQQLRYQEAEENVAANRAFGYFGTLTSDFSLGKDFRLYHIAPLFNTKVKHFTDRIIAINSRHYRKVGKYNGIINLNLQIQTALAYAYLTYSVWQGNIGIGDFTLYAGAVTAFCTNLSSLVNSWIESSQCCRHLELFRRFERIPSKNARGKSPLEKPEQVEIQFKNVSFRYPKSQQKTLKNISLTIKQGEKLSVVGLNGAGKTTFIKLLTRLYEPTEGEILLNGININQYDYQDYMKLLSVVFQDFKLLAFSIRENIGPNEVFTDAARVAEAETAITEALEKSGFQKDLEVLPLGIETSVYKHFDKQGVEFSGGQSQKLALARALYKDAPIVVLDEPTAALDPISESEIYHRFNEMIQDKTAIYISHRLSSCQFCDSIAVFHEGKLIEYGTHRELVGREDSQYAKMYQTQAQYYL